MVKGMELFRVRFAGFEDSFVLIGGAACDEWFTSFGQRFRATKDLDIVLMIETMDPSFLSALRTFIAEGGYAIRERTKGVPSLHRFAEPKKGEFQAWKFGCRARRVSEAVVNYCERAATQPCAKIPSLRLKSSRVNSHPSRVAASS
jgi:hypothetical protein